MSSLRKSYLVCTEQAEERIESQKRISRMLEQRKSEKASEDASGYVAAMTKKVHMQNYLRPLAIRIRRELNLLKRETSPESKRVDKLSEKAKLAYRKQRWEAEYEQWKRENWLVPRGKKRADRRGGSKEAAKRASKDVDKQKSDIESNDEKEEIKVDCWNDEYEEKVGASVKTLLKGGPNKNKGKGRGARGKGKGKKEKRRSVSISTRTNRPSKHLSKESALNSEHSDPDSANTEEDEILNAEQMDALFPIPPVHGVKFIAVGCDERCKLLEVQSGFEELLDELNEYREVRKQKWLKAWRKKRLLELRMERLKTMPVDSTLTYPLHREPRVVRRLRRVKEQLLKIEKNKQLEAVLEEKRMAEERARMLMPLPKRFSRDRKDDTALGENFLPHAKIRVISATERWGRSLCCKL